MRLFVAIALPDDVRDALETLQAELPVGRPLDPETLHLTLAFLGEVDGAAAEELHEALAEIRAASFPLRLAGLGTFGSRAPTVLWAGAEATPPLRALHADVRRAARRAGLELARERFRPHVTLARFRRRVSGPDLQRLKWFLEDHGGFAAGPFEVDRITLFRSHLLPGGAEHEPLAEYRLGT